MGDNILGSSREGGNVDVVTAGTGEESPALVWYGGFGSNLLPERFEKYLAGGRPPNCCADILEDGARDSSAPLAEWTGRINRQMVFAGRSRRWGNAGYGFVDPSPDAVVDTRNGAFVRAYLITVQQLEDLHRQENGADQAVKIEMSMLKAQGSLQCEYGGSYPHLLIGATHPDDDRPIVVVASESHPPLRPPHASYLKTMATGLEKDFGLSKQQIAEYLASRPGAAGHLSPQDIILMVWGECST